MESTIAGADGRVRAPGTGARAAAAAGRTGPARLGRRRRGHRPRRRHRDLGRRHRRGRPFPPRLGGGLGRIGRKALATALSDLAAMGAEPGEAYVVLGVPPDLDEEGCLEARRRHGRAGRRRRGTTLAGGDLSRGPVLVIAVTVVGHAVRPGPVRDAGGRPPRRRRWSLTGELGSGRRGRSCRRAPRSAGLGDPDQRRRPRPTPAEPVAAAGRRPGAGGSGGDGDDRRQRRARRRRRPSRRGERGRAADRCRGPAARRGRRRGSRRAGPRSAAAGRFRRRGLRAAGRRCPPGTRPRGRSREAAGVALATVGEVVAGRGVEIRLPGGRMLESGGYDQLG